MGRCGPFNNLYATTNRSLVGAGVFWKRLFFVSFMWYAVPLEVLPTAQLSNDCCFLADFRSSPPKNTKVNRFKALIIGGGGTFSAQNLPLNANTFVEGLTLPIAIMGVGARWVAARKNTIQASERRQKLLKCAIVC